MVLHLIASNGFCSKRYEEKESMDAAAILQLTKRNNTVNNTDS